jgi:hypothetical protein
MSKCFSILLVGLLLLTCPVNVWAQRSGSLRKCAKQRHGCRRVRRAASRAKAAATNANTSAASTNAAGINANVTAGPSTARETGVGNVPNSNGGSVVTIENPRRSRVETQGPGARVSIGSARTGIGYGSARDLAEHVIERIKGTTVRNPGYDRLLKIAERLRDADAQRMIEDELQQRQSRGQGYEDVVSELDQKLNPEWIRDVSDSLRAHRPITQSCPWIFRGILC